MKKYMELVLKEAFKAFSEEEIPVGAVITKNNKIIAKAYNKKNKTKNVFDHAEILCIKKAIKKTGDWRLNDCLLFVNLQPCLMCLGAIIESRIKTIYISSKTDKYGDELNNILLKEKIEVEYGLLEDESKKLLKTFFKNKRNNKL